MKSRKKVLVAVIWFFVLVVAFNFPRGGVHLHLPVNTQTWCGSGPKPDYILFTGAAYGFPFISHTIGDRERCTTIYRPSIEFLHPGSELNLLIYAGLSLLIGRVVDE